MNRITFKQWQEETDTILQEYAETKQKEIEDLDPELITKVLHLRSEMWIDYLLIRNELL